MLFRYEDNKAKEKELNALAAACFVPALFDVYSTQEEYETMREIIQRMLNDCDGWTFNTLNYDILPDGTKDYKYFTISRDHPETLEIIQDMFTLFSADETQRNSMRQRYKQRYGLS